MFVRVYRSWTAPALWLLALLFLALGPLLSPVAHAQDKSLVWERFDVSIEVNGDGSFDVTERQTIRFTEGVFTSGYRDLPIRNFGYADNWAITDGRGNVYRQTSSGLGEPYTFSVDQRGGSYAINWYFPPTSNTAETYSLSYTVHDGLRFYEEGDQLWWKAIFGDRSFPVLDGEVRVAVPAGATVQEWAAYINGVDARGSAVAQLVGNQAVVFALEERLDPGEEFEVRVEFTPNIVDGAPQPWQAAADAAEAERQEALAFRQRWGPAATLGLCALGLLFTFGG
ncbi:MAG TPA: DUF2207 domain-containing protein, partial [Caldilineaceae bacterium]|nr:DUF2207 domain-containing protein [Caldilineaceae bacterium]